MTDQMQLAEIFAKFSTRVDFQQAEVLGGGLIHQSLVVKASGSRRFVLQKINTQVFPQPQAVMSNIQQVTGHLKKKQETTLEFLPLDEDSQEFLHREESGDTWRLCRFLENTKPAGRLKETGDAHLAGRAFGRFQAQLADLPAEQLQITLPGFHDTPARWAALLQACHEDPAGRASQVTLEMEAFLKRDDLGRGLTVLDLPQRVVHNDAKLNNVLLDQGTDQPACVVDLDTVMPGSILHDFGDMMRTMSCRADEEETDLEQVEADPELVEALADGFLSEAGTGMEKVEILHLLPAGLVIIFEQAVRFLTDYLLGDPYYRTERPDHNLDRCRNQLKLLDSMYRQLPELAAVLP